ncbi:unnamed protein product [Zymoseptoria tritici ST99CH_3D7]|uniref:chitinase n=1 Tax=Zymoseptoria tritici (strain ST99CH_3D7) TaxID=1276538 RepID=A0A1X7S5S6_ZYMT9|nr:unnamed protein product [Zymoseptoria tritici ST99CH_3D7]
MPVRRLKSKAVAVGLLATHGSANAFGSRDKVAVYWGQNSFGSSGQQAQQSLATYCANTDIDIIPISFLLQMSSGQGGVPVVNFANSGNGCGTFAGTQLLDCPQISKDIQTCQDQYKKTILLSIGGATYTEGGFKTEQAAVNMANLIWNMFGPPGSNAAGIAADMTAMEAPMITSSFGFGNVSTATILARGALPTNTPAEFLSLDTNIAPVLPSSTGLFLNASTGWQSASQSAVTYSDEGVEGDAVSTDPAADHQQNSVLITPIIYDIQPANYSLFEVHDQINHFIIEIIRITHAIGPLDSRSFFFQDHIVLQAPTTSSSVPSPPAMAPSGMTLVTYTFRTTYTSIETKYETRTESIRDQGFTRNLNIDGTATDTAGNSEATSPADDGSEQGTAATVLRPFHSASVDGFDLDIEAPTQNFVPFAKRLRALMNAANTDANLNRQFYLTVAPQCPYPDVNNDAMLNGGVEFDAVFVQFYNNYCGIQSFIPGAATQWNYNFDTWNKWAVNGSANPNVKVFIGVPAGPTAAGSGYLSVANLKPVIEYSKKFSSFGGIMAWDASQASFVDYVKVFFFVGDFFDYEIDDAVDHGVNDSIDDSITQSCDIKPLHHTIHHKIYNPIHDSLNNSLNHSNNHPIHNSINHDIPHIQNHDRDSHDSIKRLLRCARDKLHYGIDFRGPLAADVRCAAASAFV